MKRLLCFMIILSMLLSVGIFSTSAKEYSYDEMADFLSKLDILHGDASKGGDYDFYSYLTRAQFAKIAVAASSYKNSVPTGTNTSPYSDVSKDHWAAGYIKVAASNRLVTGYPDSTFRPEATVLLEEAVTIVLKLLGYENSDFGGEWPYGQMGIAGNIGLLDNVTATVGSPMTRLDAIALIYNALNSDTKNGSGYLGTLGYQLNEEVVLVASSNENSSIDSDEVITSNGTYKVSKNFDFSKIGEKGDILIKKNKEIVGFFGDGNSKETFVVMSVLNGDIIVNDNGTTKILDLTDDTEAYYNSAKTTCSALASRVVTGDSISTVKDGRGQIKYVLVENQSMEGPLRVASDNFLNTISINENEATIIKNGKVVTALDVNINDIIYYSKVLNTVWAYSEKRTGIFEKATPNQETPTSVVISGVTYQLESAEAFAKFSSTGSVKMGQTVTVLLGKDGKIADVMTQSKGNDVIYGYLLETGSKEFTINNEKYSSYYATIACADGNSYQFETSKNYENYRCQVVKLTFENTVAKLTVVNSGGLSGQFSLGSRKLGNEKLASDVKIIDVKEGDIFETGAYISVYPERINGVSLKSSDVLYYMKNAKGEISELILNDVTGDNYQYGMIVSAKEKGGTSYMVNGTTKSTGTYFTVKERNFVKLNIKNNQLQGVYMINQVDSVTEFTNTYVKDSTGKKYTLSDTVQVYTVDLNLNYVLTTLTDAVNNASNYRVQAFYDKQDISGGRVRVVVLRAK